MKKIEMKSKNLQNIVLSIHRHLNGGNSLATIKNWCQIIRQSTAMNTCCFTKSQEVVPKTFERTQDCDKCLTNIKKSS